MEVEVQRVQSIASLGLDTIPPEFIRSEAEQPGLTTFQGPVPEIPVVDIGDEEKAAEAVVKAAKEWGIFQVVNHGVPAEAVRELQRVGREFFELGQEEKDKIAMKEGRFEGYGTKLQKGGEGKQNWVDFLFHNVWPPKSINYEIWPQNPPDYNGARKLMCGIPSRGCTADRPGSSVKGSSESMRPREGIPHISFLAPTGLQHPSARKLV